MLCIHSWLIWQCIDYFRWHEKPGKSNVKWKHSFLDFDPILGEGQLVENYVYHFYSCLDRSALWALIFTMYYELCKPEGWCHSPQLAVGEPGCSISLWMMLIIWVKSIKKWGMKKEFIGPGLHLRPVRADRGRPPLQWTLNSLPSASGNHNGRRRPPPDRGTLKIVSRLLIT